ncbi:CHRD domain-containing protein [Halogranum amylolyticum]|uniref:CHRD domain-containing protein n=1 Tax=Halogranum amylolyticum TaxID=660520 RepID=A0A1H8QPZ2_9EURY|nr:CHRD domain-containing protein [Halogranum amylolyticum]SEO56061.1 CHRD domain-containing protein [Halogranum amylolyticum]
MTRRRDVLRLGAGMAVLAGVGSAAGTLQVDDSAGSQRSPRFYSAGTLGGDAEVPPVETDGTGATLVRVSDDGEALHYVLLVARIEDVTQAHIHLGAADENGPVVAFLFGREDEDGTPVGALEQGVTENGVLAEGTVTADDLVGPLAGASLADLVDGMENGNTYVNVHTEEVPSGEIRGQLGRVSQVTIELTETERIEAGEGIGVAAERVATIRVSERSGTGVEDGQPTTETPATDDTPEPPETPEPLETPEPPETDDDSAGN